MIAILMGMLVPLASSSAQQGGSVTVDSHLCPDDWGDEGIGPEHLGMICDEPAGAPAFVTISAEGFEESQKPSVHGRSMFQSVPYGPIEITHTAPRGYGEWLRAEDVRLGRGQ